MNSLISVIVPVYKVEKYIHRCIDSILNQTYSNLEIILVDDGSPDRCPEICGEYAERDKRIRVIHKKNEGLGFARNSGMDRCTGGFIMFVDSDDYISEDAVQVLYERMISDGSDIAIGKHTDVYEDGSTNGGFCAFMKDAVLTKEDIFSVAGRYAVSAWGKLYRREMLEGVKYPSLKCAEDLWVFSEVFDKSKAISIVDRTVYYYVQNPGSITHEKSEFRKRDELDATLKTAKFLWQNRFQTGARNWYGRGISKAILFDNKREGIKLFKEYFDHSQRRRLLKGQSIATRVKWLSLYMPIIFDVVRYTKQALGRGKK